MGNVLHLKKSELAPWEEFLFAKRAQGVSACTLADYTRHIGRFFARQPDAWPSNLRRAALEYFSEPVAPATHNLRFSYLKVFFDWLIEEGYLSEHPMRGLKKRRAEARIVDHSEETIRALLEAPDRNTFAGLRDYAVVLLMIDTGIRTGEALRLVPEDFDARASSVTVRAASAKTRKARTLYVSPQTAKAIRAVLAVRPREWGSGVPIFASEKGTPLSVLTFGDRMERYSKLIGSKVRAYDLRHQHALSALRNGMNVLALQREMGHSTLAMTSRYVALSERDMRAAHAAASPVEKLIPQPQKRIRKVH